MGSVLFTSDPRGQYCLPHTHGVSILYLIPMESVFFTSDPWGQYSLPQTQVTCLSTSLGTNLYPCLVYLGPKGCRAYLSSSLGTNLSPCLVYLRPKGCRAYLSYITYARVTWFQEFSEWLSQETDNDLQNFLFHGQELLRMKFRIKSQFE